ncbi:M48 family metallopeptidase [Ramlibacter sp. XY19]|uniref:M48 family metallopeptidase n=1 Tax=Ramlibacter paludis TaxID=2908000 RepID=UPI0023DC5FDE|nr:M48 family metallopeptidase [Ramlibacter paludis]MCG2592917.1 M48 family metallopeptidase [Ramlibacter paludis]
MHTHFLSALALTALLAGCAAPSTKRVEVTTQQTAVEAQKQLDLLAEEIVADQARLHRVHWQVVTRSTALCPKTIRSPGLYTAVLPNGDLAASMKKLYGVDALPTVVSVVPGSPADLAGVKPRDVVVSAWNLPTSPKEQEAIRERARTAKSGEVMPVQVRRNGEIVNLTLEPVLACDYPVVLSTEQEVNAYADGDRIVVTRGMMAFARTDEELALVMSHEMAHNTMSHMTSKRVNATLGTIGDIALTILTRGAYNMNALSSLASNAHSQEFEAEADYVGLYMMANSGYAINDAPKFWRRMAMTSPGSIKQNSLLASHPSTSYRMVALEETAKEIEQKRVEAVALLPARKDGKPFVPGEKVMMAALPSPLTKSAGGVQGTALADAKGDGAVALAAATGTREVVGCVPSGTVAGDKITLADWGLVQVKALLNAEAGCANNGGVAATFAQIKR